MRPLFYLILAYFLLGCSSDHKPQSNTTKPTELNFKEIPLKWAKNFKIKVYNDYTKVELLNNMEVYQEFILSSKKQDKQSTIPYFTTPVKSIASASCVYTKIFEELGELDKIKGIDHLHFQYSNTIVDYVKSNQILEFGSGESLNTEALFILKPDVIFTWSSNQSNQQINKLIKLGIPVIFASSYLENHPLARAEWIKFFALFVNQFEQSETYFDQIEKKYLAYKQPHTQKPELALINAPYSGQWYLPNGNSYMGHLLEDANFKLYLQDSLTTGAKAFTLETIIANHHQAKYWINPSHYESLSQIENTDTRFNQLESFKNKNVYNAIKRKRLKGGNDYWELGVLRPDLILKDLNHIYKGSPNDSLFFFTKLEQ